MSVYFIADESGRVKIGHGYDPWRRLQELQSSSADTLTIIRIVQGGQKAEAWFHRRFAEYRLRGEWFTFCREMMTLAAPDEVPPPPKARARWPRQTVGESLREADRLGLLTEEMRKEYAPLLAAEAP